MNKQLFKNISKLFLVFIFCFLVNNTSFVFAKNEGDDIGFKKDVAYDIYYEVGSHAVDRVRDVKIIKKITEGNITFLVVDSSAGLKGKEGYILLDKVRAILPSGYIIPQRVVDFPEQQTVSESGT